MIADAADETVCPTLILVRCEDSSDGPWGSQSWRRAGLQAGFFVPDAAEKSRHESRLAGKTARPTRCTHVFYCSGQLVAAMLLCGAGCGTVLNYELSETFRRAPGCG